MSFKIKPPYNIDNTPIYFVKEKDGVLGRTNMNGSITINDKVRDPKQLKQIICHEMVHVKQIKSGKLSYDDKNIYWKGKKYKRGKKDGSKSYPWEKEAYNKCKK